MTVSNSLSTMISMANQSANGEFLFAGINTDVQPLADYNETSAAKAAFDTAFTAYFGFAPTDTANTATIAATGTAPSMEDFITSTPQIDAVFGANDEMVMGAIEAMQASGKFDFSKVVTVGFDAIDDAKQSIRDGILTATIEQFPGKQAAQAFQILHVDYLCNECGNCGLFCPYEGEPFRGKATLFPNRSALEASANAGFALGDAAGATILVRDRADAPARELDREAWTAAAALR